MQLSGFVVELPFCWCASRGDVADTGGIYKARLLTAGTRSLNLLCSASLASACLCGVEKSRRQPHPIVFPRPALVWCCAFCCCSSSAQALYHAHALSDGGQRHVTIADLSQGVIHPSKVNTRMLVTIESNVIPGLSLSCRQQW